LRNLTVVGGFRHGGIFREDGVKGKKEARKPLPGAKEERSALLEKLNPWISQTQDGKGETVRVVLDVPKEWIVLAAWLEAKDRMRSKGNFGSAGSIWWEMDVARLQKHHAKNYIWRMINNDMHDNLHWLSVGVHWTSYPPEKKEPENRPDNDDDIPF
jgi:hypothetical protein